MNNMDKKMLRTVLLALVVMLMLAFGAIAIYAQEMQHCPSHVQSPCHFTGSTMFNVQQGAIYKEFSCTCGDTYWVKAR